MKLRMIQNRHLCLFVLCCCIPLLSAANERISNGGKCPGSFHCASLGLVHFPFTNTSDRDCGLHIEGCEGKEQKAFLEIGKSTSYKIESITEDNKISVHDDVLRNFLKSKDCNVFKYHPKLPPNSSIMSFEIEMEQSSVYKCNRDVKVRSPGNFKKYTNCVGYDIYYNFSRDRIKGKSPGVSSSCSKIQLPSLPPLPSLPHNSSDPFSFLTSEFQIRVKLSKECNNCYNEKEGQCRLKQGGFYCDTAKATATATATGMQICD